MYLAVYLPINDVSFIRNIFNQALLFFPAFFSSVVMKAMRVMKAMQAMKRPAARGRPVVPGAIIRGYYCNHVTLPGS